MSVRYENNCVGCPAGVPCLGPTCPKRNERVYVCDDCGEDIEGDVYEVDGVEVCEGCLKSRYVRLS